jgi:hypothetical protein
MSIENFNYPNVLAEDSMRKRIWPAVVDIEDTLARDREAERCVPRDNRRPPLRRVKGQTIRGQWLALDAFATVFEASVRQFPTDATGQCRDVG